MTINPHVDGGNVRMRVRAVMTWNLSPSNSSGDSSNILKYFLDNEQSGVREIKVMKSRKYENS